MNEKFIYVSEISIYLNEMLKKWHSFQTYLKNNTLKIITENYMRIFKWVEVKNIHVGLEFFFSIDVRSILCWERRKSECGFINDHMMNIKKKF